MSDGMSAAPSGGWKDWINQKSMFTPGVAGAFTVMVANTLWFQFGLPPNWSAMAISFLIAIWLVSVQTAPALQKTIFCVLNALVIFSSAAGSNSLAAAIGAPPAPQAAVTSSLSFASLAPIGAAHAQDTGTKPAVVKTGTAATDKGGRIEPTKAETPKGAVPPPAPDKRDATQRKFFQSWF